MNYTISNDKIKVEISDVGAELQSIKGKTTGYEYLWQGDVEGLWKNRATNLFPICGRLLDGKYVYQGKEYQMILHGFIKLATFAVKEQSAEKIVFELSEDEESLKIYPFKFNLKIIFSLDGATVRTEYLVENTGNPDLPFSVGGHPGFKLPFEKGLDFSDHYIEFDKAKKRTKIDIAPSCLYAGTSSPFEMEGDKIVRLSHGLFKDDAIFLSDDAGCATIRSDKSDKFVKLTFNDVTHVGLWQTLSDKADFVCIEPWHGIPATDGVLDDFATKNEFIHLKDGEKYSFIYDITVSE